MKKNFVEFLNKSELCVGCGLCSSLAAQSIEMVLDSKGYLRPKQNSTIVESTENILWKICPGVSVSKRNGDKEEFCWGRIVDLKTGWSNDEKIRFKASSGGALSQILIYLLNERLVDGIIHIGVSAKDFLQTEICISRTPDDVLKNAGSRYAPSSPLVNLDQILKLDEKFAFVGKPCDLVGLKNYALYNTSVEQKILYNFAFFCGGIPAVKGSEEILKKFGLSKDEIEDLRYRGYGWPGLTTAVSKSGKEYTMEYKDSWGKILNKFLQLRCKICFDAIGEESDITFADAWLVTKKGTPDFREHEGRSLIVCRTSKGAELIKVAVESGSITAFNISMEDMEKMQPFHATRKALVLSRIIPMLMFRYPVPNYNFKHLLRCAGTVSLLANLKSFAGMSIRVLKRWGYR